MQPIRRGNDELPFEMVDHGMTTLFVSGVHMNFWRVHLLYFTIPSKTQNSVILKLSLFIHMDCQKVVFGVTPIILFEYFNDIDRTKRRCQQKDLQSLHNLVKKVEYINFFLYIH